MGLLKHIAIAILGSVCCLWTGIRADTTTVVLQNGLANYTGCEDSYTYSGTVASKSVNHGTNDSIFIYNCQT
ncbi:MAG: hypothetical protein JW795_16160 [Chitinivibrionales bacterium]|nr:hypothetical protein [Chitinivibrionales bacterium]